MKQQIDISDRPKETVAWFSAGATSAVACKLALKKYPDLKILYIETGSHHPDNLRFLHDCEKWYGREITILRSMYYTDVYSLLESKMFIRLAGRTPCTTSLKVDVRKQYEYEHNIERYIWGFEFDKHEIDRAQKITERHPDFQHDFPLIEAKLDKPACLCLLQEAEIELPIMYSMGYEHNNCVGCVKGGMGYWNKIRVDFPEVFERMAKLERRIYNERGEAGCRVLSKYFLDELPPDAGRNETVEPACSIFCGMIDIDND